MLRRGWLSFSTQSSSTVKTRRTRRFLLVEPGLDRRDPALERGVGGGLGDATGRRSGRTRFEALAGRSAAMSAATASTSAPADRLELLDGGVEEQPRGELVELARDSAGVAIEGGEGVGLEGRAALPAGDGEAVDDVGLDLIGVHRLEMMGGDDPLAKLLEALVARDPIAELGLAEQEDLNERSGLAR